MDFKGKKVLVTGGASGIGRAVALRLASEGADIALWDLNEKALSETVAAIEAKGVRSKSWVVDVTDRERVYAAADEVRAQFGEIDILDANAGVVFGGDLLEMEDSKILKTMEVNVHGLIWCIKAFVPQMVERKEGYVIVMASGSGLLGIPGLDAYASSKHAAIGVGESLRLGFKKKGLTGIGVTTVCPSFVATGMFTGAKAPFLTPFLETDALARIILCAVKSRKGMVLAPFMVKLIPMLKAIPLPGFVDWLAGTLGLHGSMDTWTGRKSPEKSAVKPL